MMKSSGFQNQAGRKKHAPSLVNAVRLLGVIPALNQNVHMFFWLGWWREVYERAIAQLRAITSQKTWEKAFAEGEALSLRGAVAIALQELHSQ